MRWRRMKRRRRRRRRGKERRRIRRRRRLYGWTSIYKHQICSFIYVNRKSDFYLLTFEPRDTQLHINC